MALELTIYVLLIPEATKKKQNTDALGGLGSRKLRYFLQNLPFL